MRILPIALVVPLLLTIVGCEECLDDYPHNEVGLQSSDVKKSGPDYYGGHNRQTAIVLPNPDPSTKSATTQVK